MAFDIKKFLTEQRVIKEQRGLNKFVSLAKSKGWKVQKSNSSNGEKYTFRKGMDIIELETDNTDPGWVNWAGGSVGKSGKPKFSDSGNDEASDIVSVLRNYL